MQNFFRSGSRFALLLSCAGVLALAGCGGGGSSSGGQSSNAGTNVSGTTTINSSVQTGTTANVATITVDAGLSDIPNVPYVSVTVCAPGTSNCQTIDHVLVDTGSWGLRLFASSLSPALALPAQTEQGMPVAECMQFSDGYTWGAVKLADLKIAGESAAALPIQVIDPNYASVPINCANTGPARDTTAQMGANGIIGVGVFQHDCGARCAVGAAPGAYYGCPGGSCQSIQISENLQVANPVSYFATDNNGVILELPPAPATGAPTVSGSLVFGIGTQADNSLGSAQVIGVDPSQGNFTTELNGQSYSNSIIDSGSNALYFIDTALNPCAAPNAEYYCPLSTQQLNATLLGANGITSAVSFDVGDLTTLNWTVFSALPTLAGSAFLGGDTSTFSWGLPFFYGRKVYAAIEMKSTPGGNGPYFAY